MSIIQCNSTVGKLRCGNCGQDKYFLVSHNDRITVHCIECHSESYLMPTVPKFDLKWGKDPSKDLGLPCVYYEDAVHEKENS